MKRFVRIATGLAVCAAVSIPASFSTFSSPSWSADLPHHFTPRQEQLNTIRGRQLSTFGATLHSELTNRKEQ